MTSAPLKPEGRYNRPRIGVAPPLGDKEARSEWVKRRQQILAWRKANPPCTCSRCVRRRDADKAWKKQKRLKLLAKLTQEEESALDRKALAKWNTGWGTRA